MSAPASRRRFLAAAVSPLLTLPAEAAAPSDLATACDWARRQEAKLDDFSVCDAMSEDQLDAAFDACGAVYQRAIREPSASPADIAAKARLAIPDLARFNKLSGTDTLDQLVAVILAEAAALGGSA